MTEFAENNERKKLVESQRKLIADLTRISTIHEEELSSCWSGQRRLEKELKQANRRKNIAWITSGVIGAGLIVAIIGR